MEIKVFSNPAEVARAAAEHIVKQGREAVARSRGFSLALSGGSTPKLLYQLLANPNEPFRQQIPWSNSYFFFTDERNVPPDHPDSNYRMAYEAMFAHAPRTNVYRVPGEKPAAEAARQYEGVLVEVFGPELPDFDVILLGLGEEGHTASLFPGTDALRERRRWVTVGHAPSGPPTRLTLTLGVINQATVVLFLASGNSKADRVKAVLEPQQDADRELPAALVRPDRGRLIWLLDRPAAAKLTGHHAEGHKRPT